MIIKGSVQREFATIYNEDHQYSAVTSIKGLKPGNPSWINQGIIIVVIIIITIVIIITIIRQHVHIRVF